jgi:ribosomal-protein-alanine N-acetyltransferase
MPDHPSIHIRKATANDIAGIIEIEVRRFPHPWQDHYFTDELSHDIANFYVAEDTHSNRLAGYIIFWIIEETLELHKIAVSEEYKKKGIGKELFAYMLETAEQKKVEEVFLEVRKSNTKAIKFYESFDFKCVAVRKDYYNDPVEDALIYSLRRPCRGPNF